MKTQGALDRQFLEHEADLLLALQVESVAVTTKALKCLEVYNNYDREYWDHGKWMNQQIILNTSKVLHAFHCIFKEAGKFHEVL